MNFFEGRIYKAQGMDLDNIVHSRVPVVCGSLSVQNEKLYYCKSCTYNSNSKMYDLEWSIVKGSGGASSIYNKANGQECVSVDAGDVVDDAVIKGQQDRETIFEQQISLDTDKILASHPANGSLLAATIGSSNINTPIRDLLLYASQSDLLIDGQLVNKHYYLTNRRKLSESLANAGASIPPVEHHIAIPAYTTENNGVQAYMPSYGATQASNYFTAGSSSTTAVVKVMYFGDNIYTLIGAHIVLIHRNRLYAGSISEITQSGSAYTAVMGNITQSSNSFNVTSVSIASSGSVLPAYSNNKVDGCTSNIAKDIKYVQMTFTVSSDVSLANERFMCYVKLDSSFVAK